ncbi:hypothetical protein [Oceanobacillus limi]|nr:hypothetical protein [Oceanobacillus limi]
MKNDIRHKGRNMSFILMKKRTILVTFIAHNKGYRDEDRKNVIPV